jgi:hypothetical protein
LNMVAAAWSDKIYEPNDICLRKSWPYQKTPLKFSSLMPSHLF